MTVVDSNENALFPTLRTTKFESRKKRIADASQKMRWIIIILYVYGILTVQYRYGTVPS